MKQVSVLSENNSIVNQILTELRDKNLQINRFGFRRNIELLGTIMGYELSKKMNYAKRKIQTPLAETTSNVLDEQPVIATILRAGIPLQIGVSKVFGQADLAYISAYRKQERKDHPEIVVEYIATPALDDRILILTDPMIATGESLSAVFHSFAKYGKPKKVYIAAVIGSEQGVKHVLEEIPDCELIIGAIDPELNDNGYIVPGLGDAGDLSFGVKLHSE